MANKKISELPFKSAPVAGDIIPIVDATNPSNLATKRTTVGSVFAAFSGSPNGVASLDAEGKVPITQLPAIAINDTFVVDSEAELVALAAEVGDVAVRTDLNKSFILAAEPASSASNWVELLSSGIPSDNSLDGGNF
jgi:hypothetical protein